MVWLVDDIAEAALGPWGLVIGVGLGAAVLARKRLRPVEDLTVSAAAQARQSARQLLVELPLVGSLPAAVAGAGEWWSDLYAEARTEWEAGRGPRPIDLDTPPANAAEPTAASSGRGRGPNGRFLKQPS